MKGVILVVSLLCATQSIFAEEIRLLDLDPPEAQQQIEKQDQSLHYAPKVDSNVPAVRFLGNEPHNVLEDIYLARQYHGQDGLGGYLYGYNIPDIAKTEKKIAGGDLRGAYNYKNDDGQEIKVEYWDDGTGFHQIDNVPKILPKQIDDLPEVKAEKDRFLERWREEAERNQRPVESPYDSEGNYKDGPLSPQGQIEFKRILANQPQGSYQTSGSSGIYQQNGQYQPVGYQAQGQSSSQYQPSTQYQPSGQYQPGGQYQQPGQHYQSGQPQSTQYQQPGQQYQASQSQSTQYQQPGQYSQSFSQSQASQHQQQGQPGQYQQNAGQYQPGHNGNNPNQIDYTGAYSENQNTVAANPSQGKSGQYNPIPSSSNQYSQQTPNQQPNQYQQGGQYHQSAQPIHSQQGGQYQPSQPVQPSSYPSGGQYQQGVQTSQPGHNQQPNPYVSGGQYQQGGQSELSKEYPASGQHNSGGEYQHSQDGQYQSSNQIDNSGAYDKKWDEEEGETGPPKGFFYSFDYPVGKIVQKGDIARGGDVKSVYNDNKSKYEAQLSAGQSGSSAAQSSYAFKP